MKSNQDILSQHRRVTDRLEKDRKEGLEVIFEIIRFLTIQNISFRGHEESIESIIGRLRDTDSENSDMSDDLNNGNFLELHVVSCLRVM